MRIDAIGLRWFRGAADRVNLELACKSAVIYGPNASGKSSFVDAVEYLLTGGRINHLAHEYSGKKQENAIPNRLKPKKSATEISVRFCDGSHIEIRINDDGSSKTSGPVSALSGAWDYRRTVLRQDEVATFINGTKGDKYSSLLPLLGLHAMEITAENLRQLGKNIESLSGLQQAKASARQAAMKRKAAFGNMIDDQILGAIKALQTKYCPNNEAAGKDGPTLCGDVIHAIKSKIQLSSADQRKYLAIQSIRDLDPKADVNAVRAASVDLAGAADPVIAQKLAILESAETLASQIETHKEIQCPACGQPVRAEIFRAHVLGELAMLRDIRDKFDQRKSALGALCDTLKSLKTSAAKEDARSWRELQRETGLLDHLAYLDKLDVYALRNSCTEIELEKIETQLLPLTRAASDATVNAPPEAKDLHDDLRSAEDAKACFESSELEASAGRSERLIALVGALERAVRDEIRSRSEAVISEISTDVRDMWSILHPTEAIEHVELYVPEHTDKAIDIRLKFYGAQLDSPRLTLSEGYRNSLGLCIFLAMAKRENATDRPVFLDDVVVSLDRAHRGMVVSLLERYFIGRQVVVLTHDRDWYSELRHQLSDATWTFKALLPYDAPRVGIRWSERSTTFDEARAQISDRPDAAGNDARKIMDVELAIIAEKLKTSLPFLRSDKNDRRNAHDFLERLIGNAPKCFEKRIDGKFVANDAGTEALKEANRLLLSWANRASHSFDLAPTEATALINACERAIDSFKCTSCGKNIGFADASTPEWTQCGCGELRWRYGKA